MTDSIVKYKLIDKEGFIKEHPLNKNIINRILDNNIATGIVDIDGDLGTEDPNEAPYCIYQEELERFFEKVEESQPEVTPTQKKLNIPWSMIKSKFNYCAMDEDGDVRVFENKPFLNSTNWQDELGKWEYLSKILEIDTRGINWKESLCERPIIFKDSVCYKHCLTMYLVFMMLIAKVFIVQR